MVINKRPKYREPIIGITLANIGFGLIVCLKIAGWGEKMINKIALSLNGDSMGIGLNQAHGQVSIINVFHHIMPVSITNVLLDYLKLNIVSPKLTWSIFCWSNGVNHSILMLRVQYQHINYATCPNLTSFTYPHHQT